MHRRQRRTAGKKKTLTTLRKTKKRKTVRYREPGRDTHLATGKPGKEWGVREISIPLPHQKRGNTEKREQKQRKSRFTYWPKTNLDAHQTKKGWSNTPKTPSTTTQKAYDYRKTWLNKDTNSIGTFTDIQCKFCQADFWTSSLPTFFFHKFPKNISWPKGDFKWKLCFCFLFQKITKKH